MLIITTFIVSLISAQILSNKTTISVLTCDEGTEIYSLFGHSAIRVQDPRNNLDVVYNWGMFEFGDNELDFQYRFAKGKLKYYMAEESFDNFIYGYHLEQRTVREQVLNLSYEQVLELWQEIQLNYLPENRNYQYDFFLDNCSTRIGNILFKVLGENVIEAQLPEANLYSYRELVDRQVNELQPWSDFGIDLALGVRIDKITTSKEMQFLPKYLEQCLALSKIKKGQNEIINLVSETNEVFIGQVQTKELSVFSPTIICWGVFIFILLVHLIKNEVIVKLTDSILLLFFGVLGVAVLLLWFATDHQPTKANFNMLWANPIHFLTILFIWVKKIQTNTFFLVMVVYHFAIVLFWIVIPQEYNPAFRPLMLSLVLVYYFWYKKSSKVSLALV